MLSGQRSSKILRSFLFHCRSTTLPAFHAVGHLLTAEYAHALLKCHIDLGAGSGEQSACSLKFCDALMIHSRLSSALIAFWFFDYLGSEQVKYHCQYYAVELQEHDV